MDSIRNHPQTRVLLILWASFCASAVMFVYVGWAAAKDRDPLTMTDFYADPQTAILGIAGITIVILGYWMSSRIISYNRHYIPSLPLERRVGQALSAFMVPYLLRLGVLESFAIVGLILTLRTGDLRAVVGATILAALGQISLRPRPRLIADWSGISE